MELARQTHLLARQETLRSLCGVRFSSVAYARAVAACDVADVSCGLCLELAKLQVLHKLGAFDLLLVVGTQKNHRRLGEFFAVDSSLQRKCLFIEEQAWSYTPRNYLIDNLVAVLVLPNVPEPLLLSIREQVPRIVAEVRFADFEVL